MNYKNYLINEEITPPKNEVILDDTLCVGETQVIQKEKAGIKSQAILEYYKSNDLKASTVSETISVK